jgi:hypothetical protein
MLGRILFAVFFVCGGFLFVIPYWLLVGTKGQRQRKALLREQRQTNHLLRQQTAAASLPSSNYGARSSDGAWWWDGQQWQPVSSPGPSRPR